jgi:hypothetical protein
MTLSRLCALVSVVMLALPHQSFAQLTPLPVIALQGDAQSLKDLRQALSTQLMDTATLRWSPSEAKGSADFVLTVRQLTQALEVLLSDSQGKRVTFRRITTPPGPLRDFELGAIVRAELSAITARAATARSTAQVAAMRAKEKPSAAMTMPSVREPTLPDTGAPAPTTIAESERPAGAVAASAKVESTPSIPTTPAAPLPTVSPLPSSPLPAPPIVEAESKPIEAPTPAPPLQSVTFDDAQVSQSQPQVQSSQVPDARWTLRIAAGYHVRWLGQSVAVVQGPGAEVHLRVWRGLSFGVKYGYGPPTVTPLQAVRLQLSRHEGALVVGFDFPFRFVSLTPTVSAGASFVTRSTSSTPDGVIATDTRSALSAVFGVQAHVRAWLPSLPRLKLDVAPALELALGEPRYVFPASPELVSAAPIPLRPRLDVSAVFEF